jgi:glucose-1-phosphate adenylyltransferase
LSPGVKVKAGARVTDSVIIDDSVIEEGAQVDLAILDKRVWVGRNAVVGRGDKSKANERYPKHLYTGITLLGKESAVPENAVIGRNCILSPGHGPSDFVSLQVESGMTV